jgi:guanosine-3',5'-bis(diphosphate) 3'-pyrophosphohydrolase
MKSMNDLARLIDAVEFAARKHSTQRRKDVDSSPYINHPITLASVLAVEAGVSDLTTLQAAILHDTIEDTETTYEELVDRFGAAVADVVMEVTDDKALPKDERKRLQIAHAYKKSQSAAMVKIADKTCNLRDIASSPPTGWSDERKQEYFDWAWAVVKALPPVHNKLIELFVDASDASPSKLRLAATGVTAMATTDSESQKHYERLMSGMRVAGPDDPIYSSGLMVTSHRALPKSTKPSQKSTAGANQPGSPAQKMPKQLHDLQNLPEDPVIRPMLIGNGVPRHLWPEGTITLDQAVELIRRYGG